MCASIIGKRYGRYTVLEAFARVRTNRYFLCRCDCGTEKHVSQGNLSSGRSTSCGCFRAEKASQMHCTHGETVGRKVSPEYKAWIDLKARCENPRNKNYRTYGARGIGVCAAWRNSFETFLRDMGRRPTEDHSIDRRDNDKGYEKNNCRWATFVEQQQNTTRSRFVLIDGEKTTLTKAAERLGVHCSTAAKRLQAAA